MGKLTKNISKVTCELSKDLKPVPAVAEKCEKNNDSVKSFEEILENVGCFGFYQVLILFAFLFLDIASAHILFIPVLVTRFSPDTENCTTVSGQGEFYNYATIFDYPNETGTSNLPVDTTTSESFVNFWNGEIELETFLESLFKYDSIVDEWNLKCEKSWIPDTFTSCTFIAMLAGSLFWSQLADWYGRRPTYLTIVAVMLLGTFLSAVSPSPLFYAGARVIAGLGVGGYVNISYMAAMEFLTPKWRSLVIFAGLLGEGIIVLAVLGHFFQPWRQLYLVTLVPYLLLVPLYFFLPESPRWLIRKKRISEAHSFLAQMARVNGRKPVPMEILEAFSKLEESTTDKTWEKVGYADFFKTSTLRTTTLLLFILWFMSNMLNYAIALNIRNVPGNLYVNLGLIGASKVLGQKISPSIGDRVGRRKGTLFGMVLSSAFLVTLSVYYYIGNEVPQQVVLWCSLGGMLGVVCARSPLKLLTGESFPTEVRAMGVGMARMGAYLSAVITPQLAYLGNSWPSLTYLIIAVVSLLGSLVGFILNETNGKPLPSS